MPYILRLINKNRWYRDNEIPWLQEGDVPGDTLSDWSTRQNELSVWLVDDEFDNLKRLESALAANRQKIDHLDYIIFSQEILDQAGLKYSFSEGDLADKTANSWHIAIQQLSINQLSDLVKLIWYSPTTETYRRLKKGLLKQVRAAANNNNFAVADIPEKIRNQILQDR